MTKGKAIAVMDGISCFVSFLVSLMIMMVNTMILAHIESERWFLTILLGSQREPIIRFKVYKFTVSIRPTILINRKPCLTKIRESRRVQETAIVSSRGAV